jgi:hypothetical protein
MYMRPAGIWAMEMTAPPGVAAKEAQDDEKAPVAVNAKNH